MQQQQHLQQQQQQAVSLLSGQMIQGEQLALA